jgi:hypothetical protein
MNKTFQQLMEKVMLAMMKPKDIPHMMEAMTDSMFTQQAAIRTTYESQSMGNMADFLRSMSPYLPTSE